MGRRIAAMPLASIKNDIPGWKEESLGERDTTAVLAVLMDAAEDFSSFSGESSGVSSLKYGWHSMAIVSSGYSLQLMAI